MKSNFILCFIDVSVKINTYKDNLLFALLLVCFSFIMLGQNAPETREEINGVVVIEAENTFSNDLGEWFTATEIEDFTGTGYMQFDGNSPVNGSPNSPVKYSFKINKAGLYFLHLRCARENLTINDELRTDIANDCYVRVEGDYNDGTKVGGNHGDDAPLETLMSDTKFFGGNDRQFVWSSGNRLDLGGEVNKRVAVYNFKENETYTLVVSGRSQFFKIDRFVFRSENINASTAQNIDLTEEFVEISDENEEVVENEDENMEDEDALGVTDVTIEEETPNILIYPNPANELLIIESKTEIQNVELFTTKGDRIKKSTSSNVDLSNVSSGLYFISIQTENEKDFVSKIIKN